MKQWPELTDEINTWAKRNYGKESEPWQLMAGIIEEIGEYLDAQDNNLRADMIDSLGDQAIYGLNLCHVLNIRFPEGPNAMLHPSVPFPDLLKALGKGCRSILKSSQGIRGFDLYSHKTKSEMSACLEKWRWWVEQEIYIHLFPSLMRITNSVWDSVSRRDWKNNPETGK